MSCALTFVKVIFQGQMTVQWATVAFGITPTCLV